MKACLGPLVLTQYSCNSSNFRTSRLIEPPVMNLASRSDTPGFESSQSLRGFLGTWMKTSLPMTRRMAGT